MENEKQKLAELITKITTAFPDENNLKNNQGISRKLILSTLKDCEVLLNNLREYDNHFETIILKRELSDLFEKIKKQLVEKFNKIKAPQFNAFLQNIARIKFLIWETYISVDVKQPLRTEIEIAKANEELKLLVINIEELKKINVDMITLKESTINDISSSKNEISSLKDTTLNDINTVVEEVKGLKVSATTVIKDLQEKQNISIDNEQKTTAFLSLIETYKTTIEGIEKNTIQWDLDIKKAKDEITVRSTEYETLSSQVKIIKAEIDTGYEKIYGKKGEDGNLIKGALQEVNDLKSRITTFVEEQEKKFAAQFKQIETLLPGATSAGLAGAFEKQKKSYSWPIFIWSLIFITVTTLMTGCSIYLFYNQFLKPTVIANETLTQGIIALFKDLPFFIPTIWLAVFASKQQSQFKRLKQEYVFKEINAKSFYGYKKQIEELMTQGIADKELLLQLIKQLVDITAQNPSYTLDNKAHNDSPPVFRFFERIFPNPKGKYGSNSNPEAAKSVTQ